MTKEKLKALLISLNIEANKIVQTPEIRTLLLTTNQGIDYHRDFLFFDTVNNIIKIKQYTPTGAAGRINDFKISNDGTMLKSLNNNSISYSHPIFKFRKIQVRDKVFILNKNTKQIEDDIYNVLGVSYDSIVLDKPLKFNKNTQILCYSQDGNMVQDVKDKSLFLKYIPYTNNKFDIYLDGNALLGIELQSKLTGNS